MQGHHAIQLYDRMEGFLKKNPEDGGGIFSMFPPVDELGDTAVLSPTVTRAILAQFLRNSCALGDA